MKYQSVKLTQRDGTMYHLGVKEDHIAKKVILIPDPQDIPVYAEYLDDAVKMGVHREYVTYTGTYKGQPLTIMSSGFGCMPMAIAVEELNHLGVEEIVKIDFCAAMGEDLEPGTICAASGAIRGEFASREYIDVSYPAVPSMDLMSRIFKNGISRTALFRSHDVLSLETPLTASGREKIAKWAALGAEIMDRETSAMFVISNILKVKAASITMVSENYTTGAKKVMDESCRKALFEAAAGTLI